ncbi:MAG: amidohydrolase [Oscillospiraceae bacterium]|nr:amidohydrolase [Oscillospiraceae bacterium]
MQIVSDRRALHRIPELELQLPKTMEYLKGSLQGLSCRVFSPTAESLCAYFDFGAPETVAFRADCDALPICEQSGAEYASTHPGQMHACGHDGHMAILLELARRLDARKENRNNILLIFQPGEEAPGGALPICKSGVLEEYKVKAIFGLHLWPGLTFGKVFSRENELMSSATEITVDVYGKSAHIAKADQGVDATEAAVAFYTRAYEMERSYPADVYRLLKFGKFSSGTVRNALSAHCHIEGSLRSFETSVFEEMRDKLMAIAKEVEAQFGCEIKLHFNDGYPAVMNDPALYRALREQVQWDELDAPSMTGEDFGFYQRYIPGVFFFLGLGDVPALHSDHFNFDDAVLCSGADLFEQLTEVEL